MDTQITDNADRESDIDILRILYIASHIESSIADNTTYDTLSQNPIYKYLHHMHPTLTPVNLKSLTMATYINLQLTANCTPI